MSGASCDPMTVTTDCPYPPPRATATTDCACGETGYKTGKYAWQCSPTYVYPAPPASGSACGQPGGGGIGYGGLGWSFVCECPEAPNPSAWWCTMFGTSSVSPGSSCASFPRGYELWQPAGANRIEACTCGTGANPVWACTSKSCPASRPADGSPCIDFPSFSDFPSEPSCAYGAKSCICEASGLWLCG